MRTCNAVLGGGTHPLPWWRDNVAPSLEHGKAVSKGEKGSSDTLHELSLPVRTRVQLGRRAGAKNLTHRILQRIFSVWRGVRRVVSSTPFCSVLPLHFKASRSKHRARNRLSFALKETRMFDPGAAVDVARPADATGRALGHSRRECCA